MSSRRCAICSDAKGNFIPGQFGDPESDWTCPACRRWNEDNAVDWKPSSRHEQPSDQIDSFAVGAHGRRGERPVASARLADCIAGDDEPRWRITPKRKAVIALLLHGRRVVVRRIRRRIGGRRVYVPTEIERALTKREIAARARVSLRTVVLVCRALRQ